MTDLHYKSLLEIGMLIQLRKLSSVEITSELLARIENLDKHLHSYFYIMAESALKQAADFDKEINIGFIRGPMHGVPIALKDLIWTKNAPASHGMKFFENNYPKENSTIVNRFLDAGAVILGKLTQTEGAFSEHHADIMPPVNPWNKKLWTGVSSSGSGVATAAGLCFGAIGSDTGGSIRFPSNSNGVTGIKPTWGRVTRHGTDKLAPSLDHIGPIARSAEDAAAMLQIIAGRDQRDPTTSFKAVPDFLALINHGVSNLRIGIDKKWSLYDVDSETCIALLSAISTLQKLGAKIIDISMPDKNNAAMVWHVLCAVEAVIEHKKTQQIERIKYGTALSNLLDFGSTITAVEYQSILEDRTKISKNLSSIFNEVDLILSPVSSSTNITHDKIEHARKEPALIHSLLNYTCVLNLSGHPSITLPCGTSTTGAPIGFQLVAAHFHEAIMIQTAWAYQQVTDWHKKHPKI